jgi:LPXTG-motif cell wall-anchored protein
VNVVCDDGTTTAVSLPGTGGSGPLVSASVGAQCTLLEDASTLPAGVVVTYSLDGGPPSATPPTFTISATDVVTVTITNDASAVVPVTTVPTTAPTAPPTEPPTGPSVAPTTPGTLPPTGSGTNLPLFVGLALLLGGLVAIGYTTRRRASGDHRG